MTTNSEARLDIRPDRSSGFYWVLQMTGPVRDLCRSTGSFESRGAAVANFQQMCDDLEWVTLVNDRGDGDTPGD